MRIVVAMLVLCLLGLASGAARYAHEFETHAHDHDRDHDHPVHDESHCTLHATLAAPAIAGDATPVLIAIGTAVTFLTDLPHTVATCSPTLRLDCRGPPACA